MNLKYFLINLLRAHLPNYIKLFIINFYNENFDESNGKFLINARSCSVSETSLDHYIN